MSKLSYTETIRAATLLGECMALVGDLRDELSQSEEEDLWMVLSDIDRFALGLLVLPRVGQRIDLDDIRYEGLRQVRASCTHHLREISETGPDLTDVPDEGALLAIIQHVKLHAVLLGHAAGVGPRLIFPGPASE